MDIKKRINTFNFKHIITKLFPLPILCWSIFASGYGQESDKEFADKNQHTILNTSLPVIGAWFWGRNEFNPDGYKWFIDEADKHSCYNLLTTAIRVAGRDITDIDVHNQVARAVDYAKERGIGIALDLDPRLASRKFEALYPDELQQSLWLNEVSLSDKSVETVVHGINLNDHMTGSRTPYISLKSKLSRVYSYKKSANGIIANTLKDITNECIVNLASNDSLVVTLPSKTNDDQDFACVMATFDHLVPDVFAPHLIEFTRDIIHSYSDIGLAGGMRDEWGFPPSFPPDRMVSGNHFWYSPHYADAYSKKTNGRELLADCLLMFAGIGGKEDEQMLAVNHYMELNWQRNKELEEDFYNTIKQTFGKEAFVVTHPTWYPYPNRFESKKNGLFWWAAKRDLAQTDEVTPFAVRTALSKKWGSPVWYNQYYSTERDGYEQEIWASALAGGRINYHSFYPSKKSRQERYTELFEGDLMKAESRVRLLNYVVQSPVDCPVAVVFGHAAAINWKSSTFESVGMEIVNQLWAKGIYTDLIPSSEIENGSLKIDEDGYIRYGEQKYAAVILYNPEFEKLSTAHFFQRASKGRSQLFMVGNWTMDFNGNRSDEAKSLPTKMISKKEPSAIVSQIEKILKKSKIELQTPASRLMEGFGYTSNTPPLRGYYRSIDGTFVLASGAENVAGDIIDTCVQINSHRVQINAEGVAAIKLDANGHIQRFAAGGLKHFKCANFNLDLNQRIDIAFWKNGKGEFEGVIQNFKGEIPSQLLEITSNWTFLKTPEKR